MGLPRCPAGGYSINTRNAISRDLSGNASFVIQYI